MRSNDDVVLSVTGLVTEFHLQGGRVSVVKEVSFDLCRGKTLCLVGESGCGKSITSLSVMGLLPPEAQVSDGEVTYLGADLLGLSTKRIAELRGNEISMIFQQPMTSLNPSYKIGPQIAEVIRLHRNTSRTDLKAKVISLLEEVGIPAAETRYNAYPHELSGGMAQRVMIAMALACEPKVLIADEPTTALDVTTQAQILDLIVRLQKERDTAVLFITHDLGVVAEVADKVAVMYAGEIVERGPVTQIFDQPRHPYTRGLMGSAPGFGDPRERLNAIPGRVPAISEVGEGCPFAPRCTTRIERGYEICRVLNPLETTVGESHTVRCWDIVTGEERLRAMEKIGAVCDG